MKAELSNALNLKTPEITPAPDAPKSVDLKWVEPTPHAEPKSPFRRKKIPVECEKAYQKHQDTIKKRDKNERLYKDWYEKHGDLLASEPTRTQRLFAKIGLSTAKIERYDFELSQATKALSNIAHNRNLYNQILGDKNSLALIEQYNAAIDHNAKISEYEAQAKIANAAKLERERERERERELAEEEARQLSEPYQDWTVGCDPTRNKFEQNFTRTSQLGGMEY